MGSQRNVAVLVGSLRKDSFSRKIAEALSELAPAEMQLGIVEIGQLPFYNQDDEVPVEKTSGSGAAGTPIGVWTAFRQRVKAADAVLFVTPEYNRSVPGSLKNAIDVGSRPHGQSAWDGKPGAVISVTPGPLGAFGANHHLRQSFVFLNIPAMPQPEAYIAGVSKLLDKTSGKLTDTSTREFLQKFLQAFAGWIETHAKR
jgi:chromate reductase